MLPARPGFVAVVSHAGEVAVPCRFPLAAADRHLLFGLLALQNGIINQGQLVAASRPGRWTSPGAWPTTCASQQAAPSEKSAAPRTRAMSRPAGESSAEPSNTRTITDGAIASATPVPASLAFCPAALAGSRAPGCSAPSAALLAPSAHDPGLNSAQRKPRPLYRSEGSS